jgi:hypothetical protein
MPVNSQAVQLTHAPQRRCGTEAEALANSTLDIRPFS